MTTYPTHLFAALSIIGCQREASRDGAAAEGPRGSAYLVEMSAWSSGDPALAPDPLPDHRDTGSACPIGGTLMEGASFEIRTATCTYGWFQQPALADLRLGDTIEVVFWHSALLSDPPAVGHVALFVGEELLFERNIDIPSDPAAYTEYVSVGFPAAAGEVVTLHVHNHGANDWNFLRVERVGEESP